MSLRYILTFSLIVLTACSSAPKLIRIPHGKNIKINYIIEYPNYKGLLKSVAEQKRNKYLNSALIQIYASIYRLGYFGKSNFNPDNFSGLNSRHLYIYKMPFRVTNSTPLSLSYNGEYNYGKIEEKSSSYGIHNWSYPLADTSESSYLVTSDIIQTLVSNNLIIFTKQDLTKLLNKFYKNHKRFKPKSSLASFLNRHAFKFVKHHRPIDSLYEIFKRYRFLQSGSGLSDEMVKMPNSLYFSLQQEINRQFVWGLTFLLNSSIFVNKMNKSVTRITITVPISSILKDYETKPLSNFIEQ